MTNEQREEIKSLIYRKNIFNIDDVIIDGWKLRINSLDLIEAYGVTEDIYRFDNYSNIMTNGLDVFLFMNSLVSKRVVLLELDSDNLPFEAINIEEIRKSVIILNKKLNLDRVDNFFILKLYNFKTLFNIDIHELGFDIIYLRDTEELNNSFNHIKYFTMCLAPKLVKIINSFMFVTPKRYNVYYYLPDLREAYKHQMKEVYQHYNILLTNGENILDKYYYFDRPLKIYADKLVITDNILKNIYNNILNTGSFERHSILSNELISNYSEDIKEILNKLKRKYIFIEEQKYVNNLILDFKSYLDALNK